MKIKEEKGILGVDISASILIIVIFITLIGNLIVNINRNSMISEKKSEAFSYAVQEIEMIKAKGYLSYYDSQGLTGQEILTDENEVAQSYDITNENDFTGYHKKILIQDYVSLTNTQETNQSNILKQLTVEISYNLFGNEQQVSLTTFITK